MSFQLYQLEKAQALDLLNRIQEHVGRALETPANEEGDFTATSRTIDDLYFSIRNKRTEFDERTISLTELADAMQSFQLRYSNTNTVSPEQTVSWFARYFSNWNCASEDFELAAGFPLQDTSKLLNGEEF